LVRRAGKKEKNMFYVHWRTNEPRWSKLLPSTLNHILTLWHYWQTFSALEVRSCDAIKGFGCCKHLYNGIFRHLFLNSNKHAKFRFFGQFFKFLLLLLLVISFKRYNFETPHTYFDVFLSKTSHRNTMQLFLTARERANKYYIKTWFLT